MKKIYFLVCVQIFLVVNSMAQAQPKGMNYQAVALNKDGKLISEQPISLMVNLFTMQDTTMISYFSETHEVNTSASGLFNVIIGEGKKEQGNFNMIPWNSENIWLEMKYKEKGQSGFTSVSQGKLMAVPYAMHTETATKLSNNSSSSNSGFSPPEPGIVSTTWSVFGNAKTDNAGNPFRVNSLGTTDRVDLIMITDNIERLRMLATGDIITKLNFNIGKNLNVNQNLYVVLSSYLEDSLIAFKNVFFNTSGGSTTNLGPFTVANQNPTLLTGSLTVDKATDLDSSLNVDGPSDLNSRLFVNNQSPTLFTGTLQVDSVTNLNDSLNVLNMSPANLSGKLKVDSCATFNDKVKIVSQFSTDTAGTQPSGSLQVGGGAYIKGNLVIGGVAKFGGPVVFGGPVRIKDITESTSTSTGALVVAGGVGIGLNLNVGGASMFGKMTTIKSMAESLDSTTGALKVLGGVGIRKNLHVGGDVGFGRSLTVTGATTLDSILNVNSKGNYIAHFINTSNNHGLSIQIQNPTPGWSNHFVEFRNSGGGVVGRIEGENASEYKNNPAYVNELAIRDFNVLYGELLVTASVIREVSAIAYVVAAAASFTTCVGLGACVAAPVISFIVQAALELASASITLASNVVGLVAAKDRRTEYITYKDARIGVTYESGSADYAEWLPKAEQEEDFLPGQIVGMNQGRITKKLEGCTKLFVISTNPIVLGNMQDKINEKEFVKVAFLGQVPVQVTGLVNEGDYIIPSGKNDGVGIAISPSNMEMDQYTQIVGVSWSSSSMEEAKLVNVAVGLNDNDIQTMVSENEKMLVELRKQFDETYSALQGLIPEKNTKPNSRAAYNSSLSVSTAGNNSNPIIKTNQFDFRSISRETVLELISNAENSIKKTGAKLDGNPFWDRMRQDKAYKEEFIKNIQQVYKNEVDNQIEKWRPKN